MSTTSDCLEDLAAAWRDWLDEQSEAQAALDVELDEVDLAAYGLAALEQAVDKGLELRSTVRLRERAPPSPTEIAALAPPARRSRRRASAPCRGSRCGPGAHCVPGGRRRDAARQPRRSGQGDRGACATSLPAIAPGVDARTAQIRAVHVARNRSRSRRGADARRAANLDAVQESGPMSNITPIPQRAPPAVEDDAALHGRPGRGARAKLSPG